MKRILLFAALLLSIKSFAQAPQGINYQAVIRNLNGASVNNSLVGLRMNILQGSPTGTIVYSESFTETTTNVGLVNVVVGQGTILSGDFTTIDWGAGPYYLEVAADANGGTNYTVMGTQQMMSVPYALYAENSGTPGPQGATGPQGPAGTDGQDGASAYETWLALGNTGTEADFIASLTGPQGPAGATGPQGPQGVQGPAGADGTNGTNGVDGQDGASAYETWLAVGNTGTEADFIASLTGPQGATGPQGPQGVQGPAGADGTNGTNGVDGQDGASAYETWLALGNTGTEADFITSLTGPQGATGPQGPQGVQGPAGADGANGTNGVDGQDGASAYETWLALGNTGTESDFIASLTGPQGPQGIQGPAGADGANGTNGVDGQDGASAYETWLALGNTGTEADFIASLTGPQGATGPQGPQGIQGPAGADGADGQGGVTTAGTNVTITGSGTVGDPYVVNATDNIDDADNDPSNEFQALSLSNDTLYLSDGNSVYLGGMSGTTSGTSTVSVNGNSVSQYLPSYLFDTGNCAEGNFTTSGNYTLTSTFAQYCNLRINSGDIFNLGTNDNTDFAKTYTILVSDTLFLDGTINGNNQGFSSYGPISCGITTNSTAGGAGGAAPNNSANYIMAGIDNSISWSSYGNSLNINPPQYSATISGGGPSTNGSCLTVAQRNGKNSTAAILSEAIKIRSDLYGSPGTANRTWNSSTCSYQNNGGDGGDGLYLICRVVVISGSGQINLNGNNGASYILTGYPVVYGGGGGGGSFVLSADEIILNSGTISNNGGSGGNSSNGLYCNSGNGGNGAALIIEY